MSYLRWQFAKLFFERCRKFAWTFIANLECHIFYLNVGVLYQEKDTSPKVRTGENTKYIA